MNTYKSMFSEAYFGKSKELLEIEKQIEVIRKKFYKVPVVNNYFGDWNGDKEVLKLNRLFEKALNIHCFSLIIERTTSYNAFTIPIAMHYEVGHFFNPKKMKSLAIVDEKGMKFVDDNKLILICHINSGLIFGDLYTPGEVLSIILHEVGHNFAEALSPTIAVNSMIFADLMLAFMAIDIIKDPKILIKDTRNATAISERFDTINKFVIKIRELVYSEKHLKPIATIINLVNTALGIRDDVIMNINLLRNLSHPIRMLKTIRYDIQEKLMLMIMQPTAYRNEKIADRFATMHGYGPELSSSLSKMKNSGCGIISLEVINKIPLLGAIANISPTIVEIITNPFDPHPMWSERLEDQIRHLRYELDKSEYDPKVKKEIQLQIKAIEEEKDKVVKDVKKMSISDANLLTKVWFAIFAGGDIRHHLLIGDFDSDLDNAVNDLRQESTSIFEDINFV